MLIWYSIGYNGEKLNKLRRTVQGYPQITQITRINLSRKHEIKKHEIETNIRV